MCNACFTYLKETIYNRSESTSGKMDVLQQWCTCVIYEWMHGECWDTQSGINVYCVLGVDRNAKEV